MNILCMLATYLLTKIYIMGLKDNDDNFVINILWISNKDNLDITLEKFRIGTIATLEFRLFSSNFHNARAEISFWN